MINPDNLNIASLPFVPIESKNELPALSAIYFAIDSLGVVRYIGRSANLKKRFIAHNKYGEFLAIGGARIAYLFLEPDLLPSVEIALIQFFQPQLNIAGVDSAYDMPPVDGRVRGRFAKNGAGFSSVPIATRYSDDVYDLLMSLGSMRGDFIRSAVAEKLARSGALVEDIRDRV